MSTDAFPYYAIYCSISEKHGKVILTNLNAILIQQTVQNDHNPWEKTEKQEDNVQKPSKEALRHKARAKRRRERLHFRAAAFMLDAIRAATKMQLTREEGTAMTNKYLGIGKFKK